MVPAQNLYKCSLTELLELLKNLAVTPNFWVTLQARVRSQNYNIVEN